MTIAELKGKLSPDSPNGASDRMEDLLTSDVFGTMRYVGFEKGFIDWIVQAQSAPVSPASEPIPDFFKGRLIETVRYSFWPTLPNGREPDVALLFFFNSGLPLLIVVEAKYFSGTSDWDDKEKNELLGVTGNQIADQVLSLGRMTIDKIAKWFELENIDTLFSDQQHIEKIHLFVTMHSVLPSLDYQKSKDKVGSSWPIPSYWLSWDRLASSMEPHIQKSHDGIDALLQDLYLLLKRKGLIPFQGFNTIPWQGFTESPTFFNETFWDINLSSHKKYQSFLPENNL